MVLTRGAALALVAALWASTAIAQSSDIPAELPPASYAGAQYVDSRGCVFIRAGVDGNVTWVPRVSRARSHICGQTPTLSASQIAVARAPRAAPPVPVISIEPDAPVTVVAPAPAPVAKPRVVVQAKPQPQPRRVVTAAPKAVAQPVIVQPVVGKPAPRVTYAPAPVVSANVKSPDQIGIRSKRHAAALGLAPTGQVHPHALVIPKHVYAENVAEQQHNVHVPHGYRTAWEDDRLNLRRAYGTLAGKEQMELIWTRTVPRQLIDRKTGRDVTAMFPSLFYPFTSQAQLDAARLAAAEGKTVKVRVKHAPKGFVSTKSTPARPKAVQPAQQRVAAVQAPQPARVASHRFVQVGTFGQPGNAQAAIRRLQSMGLPVKVGQVTRKGQALQIVLAGPFATQSGLDGALSAARRAGFGDAFLRK